MKKINSNIRYGMGNAHNKKGKYGVIWLIIMHRAGARHPTTHRQNPLRIEITIYIYIYIYIHMSSLNHSN